MCSIHSGCVQEKRIPARVRPVGDDMASRIRSVHYGSNPIESTSMIATDCVPLSGTSQGCVKRQIVADSTLVRLVAPPALRRRCARGNRASRTHFELRHASFLPGRGPIRPNIRVRIVQAIGRLGQPSSTHRRLMTTLVDG